MLLIAMSGGDMLKQDPGNIAAYPAVVPTAHDVLFGRNARCWNHEGNRKFRKIISRYQDDYHTTKSRSVKVAIVSKIAEELSLKGVRFLKQNPETKEWTVVDRDTVIEKIGHAIRDRLAISQKKEDNAKKREADAAAFREELQELQKHAKSDKPGILMANAALQSQPSNPPLRGSLEVQRWQASGHSATLSSSEQKSLLAARGPSTPSTLLDSLIAARAAARPGHPSIPLQQDSGLLGLANRVIPGRQGSEGYQQALDSAKLRELALLEELVASARERQALLGHVIATRRHNQSLLADAVALARQPPALPHIPPQRAGIFPPGAPMSGAIPPLLSPPAGRAVSQAALAATAPFAANSPLALSGLFRGGVPPQMRSSAVSAMLQGVRGEINARAVAARGRGLGRGFPSGPGGRI